MELNLAGKTAVVTGAGNGIGLAVTRALVAEGVTVFGGARTVSADLKEATDHVLEVDLATPDGPAELIDAALRAFGGIDILVNNVGGGVRMASGFADTDDDTWIRAFELNVLSTVRATRAALPSLIERRGAVVNISSVNATLADPKLAPYSACKAALTNITKALANEVNPLGVRVNSISPGPVRTRIWTNPELAKRMGLTPEEFIAKVPAMSGLATGNMIEVGEIASLVLLLVSGRVPNVVGSDYTIDAGMLRAT